MKLSDVEKVRGKRAEFATLRTIQDGLSTYPPYAPVMMVNGEQFRLENHDAIRLVDAAVEKAKAEFAALGVEVDE